MDIVIIGILHLGQFHPAGNTHVPVSGIVRENCLGVIRHRDMQDFPGRGRLSRACIYKGKLDFLSLVGSQRNIARLGQLKIAVGRQPLGDGQGGPVDASVFRHLHRKTVLGFSAFDISEGMVKVQIGVCIVGKVYLRRDKPAFGRMVCSAASFGCRCLSTVLGIVAALVLPDGTGKTALVFVLNRKGAQSLGKILTQNSGRGIGLRHLRIPLLPDGKHLGNGRTGHGKAYLSFTGFSGVFRHAHLYLNAGATCSGGGRNTNPGHIGRCNPGKA